VGGEFTYRPSSVLKFSEGGERLLPPEQENETLHLHQKQRLTWWLYYLPLTPWEDRDSKGDFSPVCRGQKSTCSWTGLLNEWPLQLQEMKEQKQMAG